VSDIVEIEGKKYRKVYENSNCNLCSFNVTPNDTDMERVKKSAVCFREICRNCRFEEIPSAIRTELEPHEIADTPPKVISDWEYKMALELEKLYCLTRTEAIDIVRMVIESYSKESKP
jgi:hypothetical protein